MRHCSTGASGVGGAGGDGGASGGDGGAASASDRWIASVSCASSSEARRRVSRPGPRGALAAGALSAVTGASSTKKPLTRSYLRSAVEPPSDTYSRAVVALAYRSRARGFPVGLMGTARSTSPSTSIATFRTGGTGAHRQCSGSPSATAGGSPSPSNGLSRSASYIVSPSA